MASVAGSVRRNRINAGAEMLGRVKRNTKAKSIPEQYRIVALGVIISIAIVIFMVATSAYCAKLQTENNNLENNITHLEADIDSLNEQIANQTKIENITSVAVNQLHMVYPTSENCINIDSSEAEDNGGLAAVIKDEAYN